MRSAVEYWQGTNTPLEVLLIGETVTEKTLQGHSIPAEIYDFTHHLKSGMLCPKPKPQGQFIDESEKGSAFANGDFGGELRDIDANAKPLLFPYLVALRVARM